MCIILSLLEVSQPLRERRERSRRREEQEQGGALSRRITEVLPEPSVTLINTFTASPTAVSSFLEFRLITLRGATSPHGSFSHNLLAGKAYFQNATRKGYCQTTCIKWCSQNTFR